MWHRSGVLFSVAPDFRGARGKRNARQGSVSGLEGCSLGGEAPRGQGLK